jgi:hypothetical protein
MKNECQQCRKALHGRTDKRFCNSNCKNAFNFAKRRDTRNEVKEIDGYLHRNREILATLMGESKKEMFDRAVLTRAKFRWEYMTGIYKNKQGKWYHLVYDYAWMEFTDQQILIVRKSG